MPAKERKSTKKGVARKVRKDAGASKGGKGKGSRTFTGDTRKIDGEDIKVRVKPLKSKSNFVLKDKVLKLKYKPNAEGKSKSRTLMNAEGEKLDPFTKTRLDRLRKEGVVVR